MYETRNDLTETIRLKIIELCNSRLADSIDLQTQCKHAHWNVEGPTFIALHKLFDEVNEDIEEYVDLVAERIVQLGGIAEGTARVAAKRSNLAEYKVETNGGMDHVRSLASSLASYEKLARAAISTSAELNDADTADIFTEIFRGVDKWLWMVEVHLQESK